jgi:hypothetical protein
MKQLSIIKIFLGSILIPWQYGNGLINAIKLPVLGLFLFTLFWTYSGIEFPRFINWLFVLVYLFFWSTIFVITHRVTLFGLGFASPYRETLLKTIKYLAWMVLFFFIFTGFEILMYRTLKTIVYNLGIPALQSLFDYKIRQIHWLNSIGIVSKLCAAYITTRLSLVFPAIAVDKKMSLINSFNYTIGNGWRLLLAILPIPLLFLFLFGQLYVVAPPIQAGLLYFLFGLPFFLIGICGLSLTYKELTAA